MCARLRRGSQVVRGRERSRTPPLQTQALRHLAVDLRHANAFCRNVWQPRGLIVQLPAIYTYSALLCDCSMPTHTHRHTHVHAQLAGWTHKDTGT